MGSDTDASDYERKTKRSRTSASVDNDVTSTQGQDEILIQSDWGDPQRLPVDVLEKIFYNVVVQEGCLPSLVRLVCF